MEAAITARVAAATTGLTVETAVGARVAVVTTGVTVAAAVAARVAVATIITINVAEKAEVAAALCKAHQDKCC